MGISHLGFWHLGHTSETFQGKQSESGIITQSLLMHNGGAGESLGATAAPLSEETLGLLIGNSEKIIHK